MSQLIVRGTTNFDPIPAGAHIATGTGVFDLGTRHNQTFGTDSRKVTVIWEVPGSRGKFERDGVVVDLPRQISRQYTLSLSPKSNLYRDLVAWRGREFIPAELAGFDLFSILGTSCQIQIVHNESEGRTYANVAKVMALPAVVVPPAPENPLLRFSFDDESPEIPEQAPSKVKAMIEECPEWMALNRSAGFELPNEELEPVAVPDDEDHIPF